MKKELIVILILVFSISNLSGCFESSGNNNGDSSDNAEEFVFTALDGSQISLSDYRGKVVILDLWATWCNPCHAVLPELKKIYNHYSRNDLEIMSVNIDSRETVQYIESFIDWFEEEYEIDLDWIFGRDDSSILEKYMNEGAIPTLAVFDQKGRLYYRKAGVHVYKKVPEGFPENTPLLAPILDELIS
jgi:thiol-disulfide isomerase/thioredoxin